MKCWPLDLRHLQRDSDFSAGFGRNGDPAYTLTSAQTGGGNIPAVATVEVFPLDLRNALRDADREDRTGVGFGEAGDPANTVTQGAIPAVAFAQNQRNEVRQMDVVGALAAEPGMKQTAYIAQGGGMEEPQYVVRRITPIEAERLQGFPDGWTDIEYNGRPAPDTARYRALGNSMTVSVMKWLAQRILEADKDDNETNTRV